LRSTTCIPAARRGHGKLALQLEQQTLGGLLAHARNLGQAPGFLACHGIREVAEAQPG
jgi:hypothetical protein